MKFGEEMRSVINISRAQDKEKSESPTLIEPIWPTVHRSDALTTELRWTCGELGHIQGLCFTCVLRTARISDFATRASTFYIVFPTLSDILVYKNIGFLS